MGKNGGFNPFRDAHGRFADRPGLEGAGGGAGVLQAPLPAKTEWSKDGVTVEFTGGRTPAYRVVHDGQVIKEIPATTKWRQELAQAQQDAEAYLATVQATKTPPAPPATEPAGAPAAAPAPANQAVNDAIRARAAAQRPTTTAPDIDTLRAEALVAARTNTPAGYRAFGKRVLERAKTEDEEIVTLVNRVAKLQERKQREPPSAWTPDYAAALAHAEYHLPRVLRKKALDVLRQIRPFAEATDLSVDRHRSFKREVADEVIRAFPQDWVRTAARMVGPVKIREDTTGRSSYDPSSRMIAFSPMALNATMAHELGHYMEHAIPKLREAARAYLDSRTTKDKVRKMSEYDGGYDDGEVTKPDRFVSPYMGKFYPGGETEITSMMLEDMYSGMHSISAKDPAMFEWFVGVMASL